MQNEEKRKFFRRAVLAGAFAAAGVVLSVVSIPVGPTKCFPFQHTINVLAGAILGPWWAVGAAFTTSIVRICLYGTILAKISSFLISSQNQKENIKQPLTRLLFSQPKHTLHGL